MCIDIQGLLKPAAISDTVILIHDASNEGKCCRGIGRVSYVSFPNVRRVELDWLAGCIASIPECRLEIWGGIGLVIADGAGALYAPETVVASQCFARVTLRGESGHLATHNPCRPHHKLIGIWGGSGARDGTAPSAALPAHGNLTSALLATIAILCRMRI